MQVNLDQLEDQFLRDEHTVAGETVYLVHPKHLYANWRPETLKFRSSVWSADGYPVSLSFPKFFNLGEFNHVVPSPDSLSRDSYQAVEKMDGSTLIVSQYKGELIIRTRGTLDARVCDHGEEIDLLKELYPNAFRFPVSAGKSAQISYLFEWVTDDPGSRLIVQYKNAPDIILIGAINHEDYSLYTQDQLDVLARELGVKRPEVYRFENFEKMVETVTNFEGKEGICLYSKGGQNITKIKSSWYLKLHRLKTDFRGIESVIDFYVEMGCPSYSEAFDYLAENVDFETASACRGHLSSLCDVMKEIEEITDHMKELAAKLLSGGSNKETRNKEVYKSYGKTNRAQMVIDLMSGNDEISRDQLKKLIYQTLS